MVDSWSHLLVATVIVGLIETWAFIHFARPEDIFKGPLLRVARDLLCLYAVSLMAGFLTVSVLAGTWSMLRWFFRP